MAIPLIAAGLGAGLTLLGESQRVKEERKRVDAQKRALEEAKYTEEEKQNILSGINRRFNTSDLGQMNAAAYGLSGVLNSDVVRGLQSSRLLGQRTEALTQTENSIREANRNIDMQLGQLEGVSSSINVGNVALGGLAGYQIGESISKLGSKPATTEVKNDAYIPEFLNPNKQTYADVSDQLFPSLEAPGSNNNIQPTQTTIPTIKVSPQGSNSVKTNNNELDTLKKRMLSEVSELNLESPFGVREDYIRNETDFFNLLQANKIKDFFNPSTGTRRKQTQELFRFF